MLLTFLTFNKYNSQYKYLYKNVLNIRVGIYFYNIYGDTLVSINMSYLLYQLH